MKKRITKYICIASIIMIFVIPFIIHCLFKIHPEISWISAEWSAGDLLSYYGTVIGSIVTILLGLLAYYQNQSLKAITAKANKISEDMLEVERISKSVYINFDTDKCKIIKENDLYKIKVVLKNRTSNDIVSADFRENCYLYIDDRWGKVIKQENCMRTIPYSEKFVADIKNGNIIKCTLPIILNDPESFIFSFKIILTSIFGYETEQLFFMHILKDDILQTSTIVLSEDNTNHQ